jgi:hypothetical protein
MNVAGRGPGFLGFSWHVCSVRRVEARGVALRGGLSHGGSGDGPVGEREGALFQGVTGVGRVVNAGTAEGRRLGTKDSGVSGGESAGLT